MYKIFISCHTTYAVLRLNCFDKFGVGDEWVREIERLFITFYVKITIICRNSCLLYIPSWLHMIRMVFQKFKMSFLTNAFLIIMLTGIYISSFTNVHFWTKIELLNVVKCRWGPQGAVSFAMGSWQNPGESSRGKAPPRNFGLFSSGGQINSLE